jgi:ABC-2 type transport system permease protein
VLNYFINFLVGTICFYTESIWGINIMKEVIVLLLSGASIPLAFFPETLQKIVYYLPFQAIYNTPLKLLIDNSLSMRSRMSMLGWQVFWTVIVGCISYIFFKISVRKITVNGG